MIVVGGVGGVGEPLSKFAVLWWIIGKFECRYENLWNSEFWKENWRIFMRNL